MVPNFDLMLITDEAAHVAARIARALEHAEPGRVAVQLRMKSLPAAELLQVARELRQVTRARGASLLVNDRLDVALAVEAEGVHLPERGLPIPVARELLGPARWVGKSCHDRAGLERAQQAGASYATLAPVLSVPGKGPPLGLVGFQELCRDLTLPVYALGGIGPRDVPALRHAGARGVAVLRDVMGAPDPGARAFELLSHF